MRRNEKLSCKILKYFQRERKFEVQDYLTKTKGYVIFDNNNSDFTFLKDAYDKGRNVPLYFDKKEKGIVLFSCRETKSETLEEKKHEIKTSFSESDEDFNLALFDALFNALNNSIDSEEKYKLSKQLLLINKDLKIRGGLTKELFKIANSTYQRKFWDEGILPYFSNAGIRKSWIEANEEGKEHILQRLGITIQQKSNIKVDCYFEEIGQEVVKSILAAKKTIKIAMAWFTNFEIFKVIKHKLTNSDVKITLVTNNDLINNGGYCLNFNELIDAGLELYLYEYPDMLHHKFCIIDSNLVMTGSYNWTFFSESVNRENMLIIKGDDNLIDAYSNEFEKIITGRIAINRMPESVPEKPEYDRSSFKQYISEELVIRTKRRIGNAKENLNRARTLSPSYASVTQAMQDLNITFDNTNISTQALDLVASNTAIEERKEQIDIHQQQLQQLNRQRESIRNQQKTISQRQLEIQSQTQQIVQDETISEEERSSLQENVRRQEEILIEEQERLNTSLSEVEFVSSGLEQAVQQAKEEIITIQETSLIETKGGRGSLKINLKWNTIDDLDLHVFDPSGFEIYYGSKEHEYDGVKGKLDIDANASNPYISTPQENIFWEEGKNAPIGKYKVQVVLYTKRDNLEKIPFAVTIYPGKGDVKTFAGKIEAIKIPQDVIQFEYSENGISYL